MNFTEYALMFVGTPYKWGGNDTAAGGMDCSGLVLECCRAFGLWGLKDTNAQGIYDYFISASYKRSGLAHLLFFGQSTSTITHVAILCANGTQMIEAGGGSQTPGKGMVRVRPKKWRRDLVAEVLI